MEDWGWVDARYKTEHWDFTAAKDLVVWCNGPACGQSPRAIRGLLDAGYPGTRSSTIEAACRCGSYGADHGQCRAAD